IGPGLVVVAGTDALYGLDAATGDGRWVATVPGLSAPPAIEGDRVIGTTATGEVVAVAAETGHLLWQRPIPARSRYAAAIAPGRAVVLTLDNAQVLALDRNSGEPVWTRSLDGTLSAPGVARDRVLVGSTNNTLYALD